jgi:hypothetical protein
MQPEGGLQMNNTTQGFSTTIPAGAIRAALKSEEVFILCASNTMKDELRIRFEAACCVEVFNISALCARIQAHLPTTATFRVQAVEYYAKSDEMGIRWAFPQKIAFSKMDGYRWQDEYRFAFSLTDALAYGNAEQQIQIPAPGTTDLPKPITIPEPREHDMRTRSLRDICRIHIF